MTKSKNLFISTLLGLMLVLACFAGIAFIQPKKETYADPITDYRGKVVIWDYCVTTGKTTEEPISAINSKIWAIKYVVLKNVSEGPVDISDWHMYSIASSGSASYINNHNSPSKTYKSFNADTILPAGGYLFYAFGSTTNLGYLPSFVKHSSVVDSTSPTATLKTQYSTNTGPGAGNALLLTQTALSDGASASNITITSLTSEMVDLIGLNKPLPSTNAATSFLSHTKEANNYNHLVRIENSWNKPISQWNNSTDYEEEVNEYTDDTHNSLSYLVGIVETFDTIAEAKAMAADAPAKIRGTVTHISDLGSDKLLTVQDSTGAMYVQVASGNTAVADVAVKDVVVANGTMDANGVLQVDTTAANLKEKSAVAELPYATKTIAEILADTTGTLDNCAVEIKKVNFDHTNNKISLSSDELAVTGVSESSDCKITLKGIVRVAGAVKTIEVDSYYEYVDYAYGQINDIVTNPIAENVHFSAQGFITYVNGADAYLQDSSGGIQLYSTALGELFEVGNYVVIDGVKGSHLNNTQINDITRIEKTTTPPYPQTELTPVELNETLDGTSAATYMHKMITIAKATVSVVTTTGSESNKKYLLTITYGASNEYSAFLDVDNAKNYNFEVGDEVVINRGIVFHKSFNNNPYIAIKCYNSDEFIVKNTSTVADIIDAYDNGDVNEGDTVFAKGTITVIFAESSQLILQSNGKSLFVNNVQNIAQYTENTTIKVTGKLVLVDGVVAIGDNSNAPTIVTSVVAPEAAVAGTLDDDSTDGLLTSYGNLKVTAVDNTVETRTVYTVTDGTTSATLNLSYETHYGVNDYISVVAVAQRESTNITLYNSNQANVQSAMSLIKDVNAIEITDDNKNDLYIIRGVVTYIEVETDGVDSGIENLIIEQVTNNVRYAIRLYFGNQPEGWPAADAVVLGDTVTVEGKKIIYNNAGMIELSSVVLKNGGDIVHGTPLTAQEFDLAVLSQTGAINKYQGLYVHLSDVTMGEITIDALGSVMLNLTQGQRSIPLFLGTFKATPGATEDEIAEQKQALINTKTAYFNGLNYYVGDTFGITGHIGYYRKNSTGGFRLELNLDGNHTLDDLTPSDYTNGWVATQYTYTFLNESGSLHSTIVKVRNGEFTSPNVNAIAGKSFDGWVADDNTLTLQANTVYTMLTRNITFTAHYINAKYTVTFVTGTDETINPIEDIDYNHKIALPNPAIVKDGCTFGGWYYTGTDGQKHAFTVNTTVDRDYELEARWISKTKQNKPVDVTLVIIASVSITLVVVGVGIVLVNLLKKKKPTSASNE